MEKKLPNKWVEITIGQLTDIVGGGTPQSKTPEYYNGEVSWITPADLSGYKNKLIDSGKKSITQLGLAKSSARLLPTGTVLFSSRAPIGYVAIASKELSTNQGFKSLIPNSSYIPEFGYYYLKSIKHLAESYASGTTFLELSGKKMKEIPFPLAPLPEQQRIVAKLDSLFAHLEEVKTRLEQVPQLLKDFRQSVLTQAVTGKLTEEWRVGKKLDASRFLEEELDSRKLFWVELEREKSISKGKKFKESVIIKKYKEPFSPKKLDFELPKEWETCTWDQLSNWITYGFTKPMPTVDKGVPKVTVKHVKDSRIDFESTDKTTQEAFEILNEKDKPKRGDILITKDGATLGRSAIVDTDISFCIGQSVAVVWLRSSKCNPTYLNYIIQSDYIQNRIWEVARGMGMPHLSITDFRSLSIGLPTKEEQEEIVGRVDDLFSKADAIEEKYKALKQKVDNLPQAILAKAFKGELVEQLESDGDARELLEEINKLKEGIKKK